MNITTGEIHVVPDDQEPPPNTEEITADEKELLNAMPVNRRWEILQRFRDLDDDGRAMVMRGLRTATVQGPPSPMQLFTGNGDEAVEVKPQPVLMGISHPSIRQLLAAGGKVVEINAVRCDAPDEPAVHVCDPHCYDKQEPVYKRKGNGGRFNAAERKRMAKKQHSRKLAKARRKKGR